MKYRDPILPDGYPTLSDGLRRADDSMSEIERLRVRLWNLELVLQTNLCGNDSYALSGQLAQDRTNLVRTRREIQDLMRWS